MQGMWKAGGLSAPVRAVAALAVAAGIAGCGAGEPYANKPRPPAPITLTAAISEGRVSVSPNRFGAGPIELVVTNLSRSPQQLTLTSRGGGAELSQTTGRLNPSETATIKADVRSGEYTVRTTTAGIRAARLVVGAPRASAQNQLLLP